MEAQSHCGISTRDQGTAGLWQYGLARDSNRRAEAREEPPASRAEELVAHLLLHAVAEWEAGRGAAVKGLAGGGGP